MDVKGVTVPYAWCPGCDKPITNAERERGKVRYVPIQPRAGEKQVEWHRVCAAGRR